MASSPSGFLTFLRTTVLPILIALILYLSIFQFLLPLYRKHRAKYSQYLPLANTSTSSITSRIPSFLHPSNLRNNLTSTLLRIFSPTAYAARQSNQANRRNSLASTNSDDDNLLTDERGEAMVGFDYSNQTGSIEDQNRRRRDAMERQVARGLQAAREMNMGATERDNVPPEGRLSRELEEVFRDDSDEDDEDEHGVTVGRRRSMSISR